MDACLFLSANGPNPSVHIGNWLKLYLFRRTMNYRVWYCITSVWFCMSGKIVRKTYLVNHWCLCKIFRLYDRSSCGKSGRTRLCGHFALVNPLNHVPCILASVIKIVWEVRALCANFNTKSKRSNRSLKLFQNQLIYSNHGTLKCTSSTNNKRREMKIRKKKFKVGFLVKFVVGRQDVFSTNYNISIKLFNDPIIFFQISACKSQWIFYTISWRCQLSRSTTWPLSPWISWTLINGYLIVMLTLRIYVNPSVKKTFTRFWQVIPGIGA